MLNKGRGLIKNVKFYTTFDVFKKLQDSTSSTADNLDSNTRKPSLKVTKLVDEILNLTLIEVADLCNLCQDKLSTNYNPGNLTGRLPFPHPNSFFSPINPANFSPNFSSNFNPNLSNTQQPSSNDQNSTPEPEPVKAEPKVESKKKSIKLVGYEKEKKIEIIKTIRTILNISLRESKELIESYPKVIKKNVEADELEKLSKLIKDSGGIIEVD